MNWAAATGKAGHDISRVVTVAGQIQSLGKLMGGDSMQLKQMGINLEGAIGKAMGKSTQEVLDMREKGLIPASAAMQALISEMEKFGSSASKQADTIGGLMASLGDLKDVSMRNAFTGVLTAIKPVMSQVVSALSDPAVQQAIQNLGNTIGAGVTTAITFLQGLASQAQTAIAAFRAGLETGGAAGGVQALLNALGLSGDTASLIGGVLTNIVSAVQGGIAAIQSAIQGFQQAGVTGAAFNLLTALGIDPTAVATMIATVQTVIAAVQSAFAMLRAAITAAQQGMAAGPGVAAINFLTTLGLDEGTAAQIGTTIANISGALQQGLSTLKGILAAFQSGGVANGINAILQALGLDPAIVGQIASVIGQVAGAVQTGISIVVSIIGGAASLIAQNWQTILGALAGVGAVVAGFMAFQGVVSVLAAVGGALAFLLSPIGLIIAAGALLGAAWINNWGNIQGIVAQAIPIIQSAATVVGGVLVAAFMAAGAVAGWIAANWGTISEVAATLAGIIGGVLITAFNVLGGVIGFVVQHWQVFAAVLGAVGAVIAGGAILGGITAIVTAFGTFMSVLGGIGVVLTSAGGLFGALATLISLPMVPIALLVAAIGFLAVAWMTNMGDIRGGTNTYIAQIQASWEQLLGFIRAVVSFFQTPIDWSNPAAAAAAIGQAWGKLQSDMGEVQSQFEAKLAGISDSATAAGNAVANSTGQTADIVRDQYYRMPEDANIATQLMKAFVEGNFAAIPGIVGGNMEAVKQILGEKVAVMVETVTRGAAKIKSELAMMQAAGQYVSEADMGAFADTGSASQTAAIKAAPKIPAFTPPDFSKVMSGLGAAGTGAKGASQAAKSAEDKIKEANAAIQSTIKTVTDLNEMLKNGLDGLTVGDGADKIVELAGKIAALGRRMADVFAQAATGLTEDTYKGAQALGQGISAATSALSSLIGMLPKLWEFLQSDAWAEMSAVPGQVVAAASQIIQIGKAIADAFMSAMGSVSDESAKSAQNAAAVVGAASQALSSLVGMLPKLWEFINDPAFDEMMAAKGQVVNAAKKLIDLGKSISSAFLSAMGGISDESAKAAQNGAAAIQAATQSVSSIIDAVQKIVLFINDAGFAAAIFSAQGRASVKAAAAALISLGVAMFEMFVDAAGNVSAKASASAKRLGEGLQAMGQGLAAIMDSVTKITSFMHDGMNVIHVTTALSRGAIVTMVGYLTTLGQMMLDQFAQVGAHVSSTSVAAAKRLADGLQAAGQGISSIIDAITKLTSFFHDGMNVIHTTTTEARTNLIAAVYFIVTLGRSVYDQFVNASQLVSQYHVDAAKRLSEGIKAAGDAIQSVLSIVVGITSLMHDAALQAAVVPGPTRDALVAFAAHLATLSRDVYNYFVDASQLVSQYHVDAAKRLSDGVGAALSAITGVMDFISRALNAMTSAAFRTAATTPGGQDAMVWLADNLSRMARRIYEQWIAASENVSQYHVEGAKRLAEGVQAAVSAVTSTMDVIVKLLAFASNAVYRTIAQSQGARTYFANFAADIMKFGKALIDAFTQASIDIGTPVVDALKRFSDAVGSVTSVIGNTLDITARLVSVIRTGVPQVDADALANNLVGPLVRLGVKLTEAAAAGATALTGLDTEGLDKLKGVLNGLLDMFKGIADLIDYVLGGAIPAALARVQATINQIQNTLASVGVQITVTPEQLFHTLLDPILLLGVTLTKVLADGTQALTGIDTSGYEKLASVMGNAQETIQKIVDLSDFVLDMLENGGLFDAASRVQSILADLNSRLASLGAGPADVKELLRQLLQPIISLGVAFTEVIADMTSSLVSVETGGLGKMNDAVAGIKTALETIPRLVNQIIGMMHASLPTVDPATVASQLFTPLFSLAIELVKRANTAAAAIGNVATDSLVKLSDAIGKLLGVLRDSLDLIGTLGGKLPPMDTASLTVIGDHLVQVLTAGRDLAIKAYETAKNWSVQVPLAFEDLSTALQQTFDIIGRTLDIVATLGGEKFPPLTGDALETIKTRLVDVLTAGKAIADKALETARTWAIMVNPVMADVGTVLSTSLEIISKTLDIVGQLGGDKFPSMTGAALTKITDRLKEVLEAGNAIADKAIAVATGWKITVNPVMTAVGEVLSSSLEIIGKTLDIVAQLGGDKFPALTGAALTTITDRLKEVLEAGKAIADKAIAVATGWTIVVNPAMTTVGTVLGASLEIVSKALDIVGQLGGDKFPPLTGDALAKILVRLENVLTAGKAMSVVALNLAKEWDTKVNPVMSAVGTVLASGLEIVSKTLDIVAQLSGDKFPPLTGDALAKILIRLEDTLKAGKAMSVVALNLAKEWDTKVNPVMGVVGSVLSAGLEVVSKTLDIVGQLSGEKFPDVKGAALQTILTRLGDVLKAGYDIATTAVEVAMSWDIKVVPAMTTVGTILAASLDIISKTLDIVGQLGGEKFPTMDTSPGSPILVHLQTVLTAGKAIADKAVLVATGWTITVNPAMALVGKVLADSLDIIGKTLDIVTQLGGEKFPPFDEAMMRPVLDRLASVLKAGKDIADRAVAVAVGWSLTVPPAMETVGKALGEGLTILKNVLEFNDLKAAIVSFKPLDMNTYGPKIDQIFLAAEQLASRFVEKAKAAGISKAMQDAADALAKVFGDAAGAIKGTIEMTALLLDPATHIPSPGQIEGKVNAVLDLASTVVNAFAAKAALVGADTAKTAEGFSGAVKSVFDAISQVIGAVKDAADLNLGTAGFNNIAALLNYLFDTFDQMAGRAEGINQVVSVITSLLGGIQALVSTAGFTAGQTWATQFAAGLAAGSAGATGGAERTLPRGSLTGGAGGGTTNIFNAPQNVNVNVNLSAATGIPDTLNLIVNMTRG
jgi:hypothetical protein